MEGVGLADLVHRLVTRSYGNLARLVDSLPSMPDLERKKALDEYFHSTRWDFVRLLVLVKWLNPMFSKMSEGIQFTTMRSTGLTEVADSLFAVSELLKIAKVPRYAVNDALRVLTKGKLLLPQCLDLEPAEPDDIDGTVHRILRNIVIRSEIPEYVDNLRFGEGRLVIGRNGAYEAELTITSLSDEKQPLQVMSTSILIPSDQEIVNTRAANALQQKIAICLSDIPDEPLIEVHKLATEICAGVVIELLAAEAFSWGNILKISDHVPLTSLTLSYWDTCSISLIATEKEFDLYFGVRITHDPALDAEDSTVDEIALAPLVHGTMRARSAAMLKQLGDSFMDVDTEYVDDMLVISHQDTRVQILISMDGKYHCQPSWNTHGDTLCQEMETRLNNGENITDLFEFMPVHSRLAPYSLAALHNSSCPVVREGKLWLSDTVSFTDTSLLPDIAIYNALHVDEQEESKQIKLTKICDSFDDHATLSPLPNGRFLLKFTAKPAKATTWIHPNKLKCTGVGLFAKSWWDGKCLCVQGARQFLERKIDEYSNILTEMSRLIGDRVDASPFFTLESLTPWHVHISWRGHSACIGVRNKVISTLILTPLDQPFSTMKALWEKWLPFGKISDLLHIIWHLDHVNVTPMCEFLGLVVVASHIDIISLCLEGVTLIDIKLGSDDAPEKPEISFKWRRRSRAGRQGESYVDEQFVPAMKRGWNEFVVKSAEEFISMKLVMADDQSLVAHVNHDDIPMFLSHLTNYLTSFIVFHGVFYQNMIISDEFLGQQLQSGTVDVPLMKGVVLRLSMNHHLPLNVTCNVRNEWIDGIVWFFINRVASRPTLVAQLYRGFRAIISVPSTALPSIGMLMVECQRGNIDIPLLASVHGTKWGVAPGRDDAGFLLFYVSGRRFEYHMSTSTSTGHVKCDGSVICERDDDIYRSVMQAVKS